MSKDEDDYGMDGDRPARRGKTLGVRVPDDVYADAEKRAAKEGRSLMEVIRSWLFGWSEGEYPSPPQRRGAGEERAQKRRLKKGPRSDE